MLQVEDDLIKAQQAAYSVQGVDEEVSEPLPNPGSSHPPPLTSLPASSTGTRRWPSRARDQKAQEARQRPRHSRARRLGRSQARQKGQTKGPQRQTTPRPPNSRLGFPPPRLGHPAAAQAGLLKGGPHPRGRQRRAARQAVLRRAGALQGRRVGGLSPGGECRAGGQVV